MSIICKLFFMFVFSILVLPSITSIKENTIKYLSLDFNTFYYEEENKTNYLISHYKSYISIGINLGSNNQIIRMRLNFDTYGTYLIIPEFYPENNLTIYNSTSSETFKFFNKTSYIAEDIMKLNKNNIIYNFMFSHVMVEGENKYITPGIIGLFLSPRTKYSDNYINFIDQLKRNNLISDYGLTFKYFSKEKGELIIGPDIDLINKNYSNKIKIKVDVYDHYTNSLTWAFKLKSIKVDDISLNYNSIIYLNLESEYFIGSYDFTQFIMNIFFNEYIANHKCILYSINFKALSNIKCENDIDIKNFPKLIFNLFENNFKIYFTYEDLFELKGNYYYFKIILNDENSKKSSKENSNEWSFGRMFFRKYLTTLNKDSKTITFYNVENKMENNNDDRGVNNSNSNKVIITLIVVITIMCVFLFLTIRKCINQQMKINNKNRKNVITSEMYYIPHTDD